jgi:hypothetical protein
MTSCSESSRKILRENFGQFDTMSSSSQAESTQSEMDVDVAVQGDGEGGRRSNWAWHESYAMLVLLDKHGKNFDLVLQELHKQHLVVDIKDPAIQKKKIRSHKRTEKGQDDVVKP